VVLFNEKEAEKCPNPAFPQQNRPKSDRLLVCACTFQRCHIILGLGVASYGLQKRAALRISCIEVMAFGLEHLDEALEVMGPQPAVGPGQNVLLHRFAGVWPGTQKRGNLLIRHRLTDHLLFVFTHLLPLFCQRLDFESVHCTQPRPAPLERR